MANDKRFTTPRVREKLSKIRILGLLNLIPFVADLIVTSYHSRGWRVVIFDSSFSFGLLGLCVRDGLIIVTLLVKIRSFSLCKDLTILFNRKD